MSSASQEIPHVLRNPQPEDAPYRGDRDRLIVVTGTDLSWSTQPPPYLIR